MSIFNRFGKNACRARMAKVIAEQENIIESLRLQLGISEVCESSLGDGEHQTLHILTCACGRRFDIGISNRRSTS
jgi:hypothetical protein